MNMRQVPHLSLKSYTDGSKSEGQLFVKQIMTGLKDYGFIVLRDHGISDELLSKAYEETKYFFHQSLDEKMKTFQNNGGQRGYTPFKVEHAKDQKHPDLKEFFHIGQLCMNHPANVWPTPSFESTFKELYTALEKTANMILKSIAQGLDLPETYFEEMITGGNSILRLIHYPPTTGEDTANSIRSAAHEDINLITLLVGATASGLQLLDRNGKWLNVESAPGEIVVDTGDMLARITKNYLPATTHRVINPEQSTSARFSMPFFVHPRPDYTLTTIPFVEDKGPEIAPINAQVFLEERLREIGLLY